MSTEVELAQGITAEGKSAGKFIKTDVEEKSNRVRIFS